VLGQFVAAAEGRADPAFWRSLFRYQSGSGPSVMTGRIIQDHGLRCAKKAFSARSGVPRVMIWTDRP
jgi:hypothetical protein